MSDERSKQLRKIVENRRSENVTLPGLWTAEALEALDGWDAAEANLKMLESFLRGAQSERDAAIAELAAAKRNITAVIENVAIEIGELQGQQKRTREELAASQAEAARLREELTARSREHLHMLLAEQLLNEQLRASEAAVRKALEQQPCTCDHVNFDPEFTRDYKCSRCTALAISPSSDQPSRERPPYRPAGGESQEGAMSRNKPTLDDFVKFCEANPNLRFWQALRNWAGVGFVYVSEKPDWGAEAKLLDTFYREGR